METDLYFCYSYCGRQKGTIANTNGLIRVRFPKQTNFDNISGTQIQQSKDRYNFNRYVKTNIDNEQNQQGKDWINNRQKKCLNYF